MQTPRACAPEKVLSAYGMTVRLLGQTGSAGGPGADELCIAGAMGCFDERSSYDILRQIQGLDPQKKEQRLERLARETSGRGHGSVLDQAAFVFSLENIPRAATLQLCLPEYLSHLQQSLRRASADRGACLPPKLLEGPCGAEAQDAVAAAFAFYEQACAAGVPPEDARYPLPLAVRTHMQTVGGPRELMHLDAMCRRPGVPAAAAVAVGAMMELARACAPHIMQERERSYEARAWRPAAQFYGPGNSLIARLIDRCSAGAAPVLTGQCGPDMLPEEIRAAADGDETQLANLKHLHVTFLLPLSINALHQAIRQRTWHHSLEPVYAALERGTMVVPPSVRAAGLADAMERLHERLVGLARSLPVKAGIPASDAVLLAPHSLLMYDLVHLDGWNVLHSLGKRLCTEAQWEIRAAARGMAAELGRAASPLAGWARPQGVLYGVCPERQPCGLCDRLLSGADTQG
jgi:thymidylate synthase ThyX